MQKVVFWNIFVLVLIGLAFVFYNIGFPFLIGFIIAYFWCSNVFEYFSILYEGKIC